MHSLGFEVLLIVLFLCLAAAPTPLPESFAEQKDVTVWAVESSKVYQCPGSRWYGTGKGKEMGECEALKAGYKPDLGVQCGSSCGK
jgi:hypothetical protein